MTTVPGNEARIRFEGVSSSAYNIWGGTQANFLVSLPGYNAREVALFLNDPSGEFLAERLGVPDTPEFRARAAEAAGMIWIGRLLAGEGHFAPTITVSRAMLEQHPDFLAELEAALKASVD